ncbi:MAG TPA: class I SAM-dependent methyltransferase [Gemmataceae bacterium]|nr:class I SAM-dependent methyltransferase [Gemmataceae bacterium]
MPATQPGSVNYWPENRCARAFWGQQELMPYRQLLADTVAWVEVRPGQRWLDLGCGGGQLSRAVWEKGGGTLAEVLALDCAAANEKAYRKLRAEARPPATEAQIRFACADFSHGLPALETGRFDGAVSGLSIQYAESWSEGKGWTTDAYDRLLGEVCRVLRPGGLFVFSVNVPEPAWGKVGLCSLPWLHRSRKPGRLLKNIFRMWRYGAWLKREARRGRFHYLPAAAVTDKLRAAGFVDIEHRQSYAGQAYVFRCRKPGSHGRMPEPAGDGMVLAPPPIEPADG